MILEIGIIWLGIEIGWMILKFGSRKWAQISHGRSIPVLKLLEIFLGDSVFFHTLIERASGYSKSRTSSANSAVRFG